MPRIPTFEAERGIPGTSGQVPISPEAMVQPYAALAQAGERIEATGRQAANVFSLLEAKKRDGARALRVMENDERIEDWAGTTAEKFKGRTDYENFQSDLEKETQLFQNDPFTQRSLKLYSWEDQDEDLKLGFERSFRKYARALKDTVQTKELQVIGDRAFQAYQRRYDAALKNYIEEPDPTRKEVIKNDIEIESELLVNKKILTRAQAEAYKDSFMKKAETIASDLDDVKADQAIMVNPGKAYVDLSDSSYLPNLKIKVRQDKVEKARRATEIEQTRIQKEQKEAEKKEHDDEERGLFTKLSQGTLKIADIEGTRRLGGDEKFVWWERLKQSLKEGKGESDYESAQEYSEILGYIDRGMDLKILTDRIIYSMKLTDAEKRQLLNKARADIDRVDKESLKKTHDFMRTQLMPKGSMLVGETPEDAVDYYEAIDQLDREIETAKKADKPLRGKRIWERGKEILQAVTPSIADRMDRFRRQEEEGIKALGESLTGKKGPSKTAPVKEPEKRTEQYEVGGIYVDAQGRRAKYLGPGKWQILK